MQLFPERERSSVRYFRIAVALSLVLHVVLGAALWEQWSRGRSHAHASEEVAYAGKITIEHLPTPAPTPKPTPTPTPPPTPTPAPLRTPEATASARVAPRTVAVAHPRPAAASLPRRFALPVPAPVPAAAPRARRLAQIHVPRAPKVAYAPHARVAAPAKSGIDEQQIAALDARFRNTIAQAQHDVATTPAPAAVHTMKRVDTYDTYLNVDVNEVLDENGICTPTSIDDSGVRRGNYTYYYLRCNVRYSDGFAETVEFPWPFKFTDANDPFRYRDGRPHSFPGQPPPPGFVLPHPFALSRAVCAFFHNECQAVIDRERASQAGSSAGG